jgi:four helix bundle protein
MRRFRGDLPERAFEFAVVIVGLTERFPDGNKGWVLGKQLLRSGTSIGANIAEADHALTNKEFVQRCSVARKEASETLYWPRLCCRVGLVDRPEAEIAINECNEIVSILATIIRKSQARKSSATTTS